MPGSSSTSWPAGDSRNSTKASAPALFGALATMPTLAGTMVVTRRIDELHREARRLRREGEEVDDDADADLARVDGFRHAERALGDVAEDCRPFP